MLTPNVNICVVISQEKKNVAVFLVPRLFFIHAFMLSSKDMDNPKNAGVGSQ